MNTKTLYLILLFFPLVSFLSCNRPQSTETEYVADNPNFVSLTFAAMDSIPGLDKAVFTLENDTLLKDSVIVNLDSLPFQTRVDSVYPTFYFKSTSGSFIYSNDTIFLTGNDTIDFSELVYVHNISADGTKSVTHPVKVNVHQVEPELYVWKKLSDNVIHSDIIGSQQKVVFFKDSFLYYISNGIENVLYTAVDPAGEWKEETLKFTSASSFGYNFQYMVNHNGKLFVTNNQKELYSTTNGKSWAKVDVKFEGGTLYNLLFSLRGNLWAISESAEKTYHFASSPDGITWTKKSSLPGGFPVSNYASLVFQSRLGNPKAIVLGGNDENGVLKKQNWSTETGDYWVNLGKEDNTLGPVAGAALIQYDGKILMFGGMGSDNMVTKNYYRESVDQGLSWFVPDTAYNKLPEDYVPRSYQSAIVVEKDKRIYLIGGKDNANTYFDVWTGKLNRMSFE